MKHKAEMRMGEKVLDVLLAAGDEIVEADDIVALGQEAVAKVGTEKTRAAGDQGQRPGDSRWERNLT